MTSLNCIALADDDSLIAKKEITFDLNIMICLGDLYDSTLTRAIDTFAPDYAIGIRGNHCIRAPFPQPIVDLHLKTIEIEGITFGGFQGSWQYKSKGDFMYSQSEVADLLKDFPPVDVFIAHNSPRNIHERDTGIHQGFDAFLEYIERVQPSYFFHGHQHCNKVTQYGKTQIIGVYGEKSLKLRHILT